MLEQPILRTARLTLRPYTAADAPDSQRLIGVFEVAGNLFNVPWPYEDGMSAEWIATHAAKLEAGAEAQYAVTRRESGEFFGGIGLTVAPEHDRAEMGYWIALPQWGQGYATEAASAVLAYAFDTLRLNRVFAQHMARNSASGRVMQKIGMRHEGVLRQHMKKFGQYEDRVVYGLLAPEWRETTNAPSRQTRAD